MVAGSSVAWWYTVVLNLLTYLVRRSHHQFIPHDDPDQRALSENLSIQNPSGDDITCNSNGKCLDWKQIPKDFETSTTFS